MFFPYKKYCLEQKNAIEYIRERYMENDLFKAFIMVSHTSQLPQSPHSYLSHITATSVTSQLPQSHHSYLSHITATSVTSQLPQSPHSNLSHLTATSVTSQLPQSHVIATSVTPYSYLSHTSQLPQSHLTATSVTPHSCLSHTFAASVINKKHEIPKCNQTLIVQKMTTFPW